MGIELIVTIFVSFIFTLCIYVLPIIAIRLKRPYSRKASHRIALWYSIGLTLFLMILRTAMGQQAGNNFWGFIFYFVNKSILHNGYNEDELKVDHTKGTSDSTQNKVNENIIEGSVNKETGGNVEQVKLNENIIDEKEVKKIFKSINPDTGSIIFPGGYDDFRSVFVSLKFLFEDKISIIKLIKSYAQNCVRIQQLEADEIIERILMNNELDLSKEKISNFVAFVIIHNKNKGFIVNDIESLKIVEQLANSFLVNIALKDKNDFIVEKFVNDEDYGRCLEKPIFVDGFKGSTNFLKLIRTLKEEDLKSVRKGSITTSSGSVDVYELENEKTLEKETIYVNLYSRNKNYYPPKGFVLMQKRGNNNPVDRKKISELSVQKQEDNTSSADYEKPNILSSDEGNQLNSTKLKEKKCPRCEYLNTNESKFCAMCGHQLLTKKFCKKCGSRIAENTNFCNFCGEKI